MDEPYGEHSECACTCARAGRSIVQWINGVNAEVRMRTLAGRSLGRATAPSDMANFTFGAGLRRFNASLQGKPWFANKCDRKTAEVALHENGKDGAFLVRPSSRCNRNQPYTLAVLYRGKVYNIPIRCDETSNHYILGKEKAGEKPFKNLPEMIEFYQQKSLILINEQNQTKDSTLLLYSVRP
ncbi:B-cell linker protein-like [Pristis pectinata]|uniref:B-cell linker protein-like n=1 Tax=Pristis pectinata TaxID=685728 RepID=UPI00223D6733|nr:B-cell linker protein-like [Pristis pectinata]